MRLGISSNYPYVFVLSFAHLLRLVGTVNIITDGLYSNLLFEGDDVEQERDGILFNSKTSCDYELIVNKEGSYDYQIVHFRPIFRELGSLAKQSLPNDKSTVILAAELINPGLHYGQKLFLTCADLPLETKYVEAVMEEKDLLLDCYFGMRPSFSLDKCSKEYQSMLLNLYNIIMNTNYTRMKQLKPKGGELNG